MPSMEIVGLYTRFMASPCGLAFALPRLQRTRQPPGIVSCGSQHSEYVGEALLRVQEKREREQQL